MSRNQPSAAEIASCISLASRAPSPHNTQPWQWRVTPTSLDLYADPVRRLHASDPFGRLLLLSCGATLHHLWVVMESRGWATEISRFPDRRKPSLLASVDFRPGHIDHQLAELAEAVALRRSDRRPMSSWEVPDVHVQRLVEAAAGRGVIAQPLSDDQAAVWDALGRRVYAARKRSPEYLKEVDLWTHRAERLRDGIRLANLAPTLEEGTALIEAERPIAHLSRPHTGQFQPVSLLLTTSSDDPLARLRAGEALSVILLTATSLGLATSIDSQVMEVETTRSLIENRVLQGSRSPQILVSVGWPSSADPLPQTPRRPNAEILSL
jgi:hypothetical protein